MIAGTADLVFAVVRSDAVYFIDVLPHDSFSKQRVFDTATTNWPNIFAHAVFASALGLEHNATDEERKMLRAHGINVLTQSPHGAVYGSIGGGVTTSGAPLSVVQAHVIPRMGPIKRWQRFCAKEPERVLAMMPEEARRGLTMIELRASETEEGEITITATNLLGGPVILGTGSPPRA
jgi:hypothetical protein